MSPRPVRLPKQGVELDESLKALLDHVARELATEYVKLLRLERLEATEREKEGL
jgi:hypothetical protein